MPNTSTKGTVKRSPTPKNAAPRNTGISSPGTTGPNPSHRSNGSVRTIGSDTNGQTQKFHLRKSRPDGTAVATRKNKMTSANSQLELFFYDQLKDIYAAEKHLAKALPKMEKAATTQDLKATIQEHTIQTHKQVARLEQVFQLIGSKAQATRCEAIKGLIKEGESAVEETQQGSLTRDAAIIMSAQKAEHYAIASYGTLVQLAETLGNSEAAQILKAALNGEKENDQNFTALAAANIHQGGPSEDKEE